MDIIQIEQILQWIATGVLKLKNADGTDAAWKGTFVNALAANRPLTADEWAGILAVVDASVQGALNA
jgi:hypothetical protein